MSPSPKRGPITVRILIQQNPMIASRWTPALTGMTLRLYQLDFMSPGISPFIASNLIIERLNKNFLYTPRARPERLQRLRVRVGEEFLGIF